MPLRLLDYTVRIMRDHIDEGNKTLPLVLPIVMYTGKASPYPYTTDIFELFNSPKDAKELMFKPFGLIDLSSTEDKTILKQKWASLLQMVR